MMNMFKGGCNNAVRAVQLLYRLARGTDYKMLNKYIVQINQQQDIDTIMLQLSRCLYNILDYEFFAFAVYDKEYNGGVDIWMDPVTENMSGLHFIKKDFFPQDTYYNIRRLKRVDETAASGPGQIDLTRVVSSEIMDSKTRAVLYIIPRRPMQHYQSEILDTVSKIIASSIGNFIDRKKLENAALIDPLTHCYNRRAMDDYINHELANAERYGSDLSAIMFDIDHFKRVNDTYGHKAGDTVLHAVSKSVLSAIRKSDYLARYGGEEFLLILPDTKFSKAIELADRLRKIIESMKMTVGTVTITATASFGVSTYRKGIDKNTFLQKADEMLYEAKRRGRNRIKPDLRLYHTAACAVTEEKSTFH